MANTPYYTKAESDAISEYLKKTFGTGIIGTVTPNVGGIPQLNGANITENGYYIVSQNGDYGTLVGVSIDNNFPILEVRNIATTATYSKVDYSLNVTFDATPTSGSANAVESGGIFTSLGTKTNQTDYQDATGVVVDDWRVKLLVDEVDNTSDIDKPISNDVQLVFTKISEAMNICKTMTQLGFYMRGINDGCTVENITCLQEF